jgi:hypothetical protein
MVPCFSLVDLRNPGAGLFRPGPKSVILDMGDVTDKTQGTRDSEQNGHKPQYSSPTAE